MLAADPTAPEITGDDAARISEIRSSLAGRVEDEEFDAWTGRGLDDVVETLLPLLAPRPLTRAATW